MPIATKKTLAQALREGPKIERLGRVWYRKLAQEIEARHPNHHYVAIDIETGAYLVRDNSADAGWDAEKKFKGHKIWIQRVRGPNG